MEFKENTDFDLIGLGEVMLRLSPPNKEKISQSETFEKNVGGSELNVVSGAAMLGIRSATVTKLPENKMGHFIRNKIRYGNVSDDYIIYDHSPQKRLGVYFYESGAYPRKSSVIYDRANSSFCSLSLDELPEDIYAKTKIFHISSITLALDPSLKETAIKMIHKFHEAGAYISFDVNYRASLWSEEEAKKTVEAIFPYVDFLFVSEETSRRMLQRTGTLEEITEIMSKVSLKQLNAPCIVYNLNGYYDSLKAMLKHMIDMGLSSEERQKGIYFAESLEQITDILCSLKED